MGRPDGTGSRRAEDGLLRKTQTGGQKKKRGKETERGGNGSGGRLDCLREEEAQKNLLERSRYRYSHFLKPSLYIYMLLFFSFEFFLGII